MAAIILQTNVRSSDAYCIRTSCHNHIVTIQSEQSGKESSKYTCKNFSLLLYLFALVFVHHALSLFNFLKPEKRLKNGPIQRSP